MSTILMEEIDFHEAERLFRIIHKYNSRCSLEMKVADEAEPMLGIANAKVSVDYFQDEDESKYLLISLNDADFSFGEKSSTFHKYVSGCQIEVCISSDRFSAFFNSDALPMRAILEAHAEK